ncbi:response regulator [Paenibacillus sp. NPDC056579]|uniref:response regulator n=1 Tax=Paenibacillus sp. NPDC056579 TaxID=3345871 RepID=UPI0036890F64
MLKAVLIDDEEIALDVLEIVLQEVGGVSVEGKFFRVDEALAYLEHSAVDLIFLDIEMPGMNGLAVAERLSQRWPGMQIIFVTAYQEYAVEAFEVNAFGYLLKPVSKERLAKTLDRYRNQYQNNNGISRAGQAVGIAAEKLHTEEPERRLFLNALGSMELYDSHRKLVTWRTKKAKEMFAYLWHYNGTPVQRDRILDDLWPELPFDRAQALLHTTLYHVRNTLKQAGFPDMIVYGDERYWMKTEYTVSDTEHITGLIQSQETDVGTVEQIIGMYRGDYFEAEHYIWAEVRRSELRSCYLTSLDRLLGYVDRARREEILRKMIKLEPYTEAYYKLLLQDLKSAGNTSAAQTLKGQMVQKFQSELGIELALD